MTKTERLKSIISEAQLLINKRVDSTNIEFQTWLNKAKGFIITIFDEKDYHFSSFASIRFWEIDYVKLNGYAPSIDQVEVCKNGLLKAIGQLNNILEYLEDSDSQTDNLKKNPNRSPSDYRRVFIVHGHDGELKQAVARIIEKQNIEAIVLSEKVNQSKTIIEKIEKHSDVGGAICLFTADDLGKEKNETEEQSRARQNVVFEAGFFMGKLGRENIVFLADQGIEMPSDLSGILYTNTKNWELDLLKELKAMGYNIDLNKLYEG